MTLSHHGWFLMLLGRASEARARLEEALELVAASGMDSRLQDHLEGTLALVAMATGDYEAAEAEIAEIMSRPERTDFAALSAPRFLDRLRNGPR